MVRAAGVTLEDFGRLANEEVVSLSRKRKVGGWRESRIERDWIDYTDTAETSAMRDDMRRVNAWLERDAFSSSTRATPWGNASISAGDCSVDFGSHLCFPVRTRHVHPA